MAKLVWMLIKALWSLLLLGELLYYAWKFDHTHDTYYGLCLIFFAVMNVWNDLQNKVVTHD